MSKSQYKCQRPRSIAGPLHNRHSTCKTRLAMAKEAMAKEAQVQGHMVMEAMAQAKICKSQLKSQHLRSILGPVDNRHSTRKTCLAMAKEALVPGPVMEALVPGPVMEAMAQANL